MKHIKKVDGLSGCYRGLTPKLVGSVVGVIGSKRVAEKLGLDECDENESKDESELTDEERYKNKQISVQFLSKNLTNLFAISSAVTIDSLRALNAI